MYGTYDLDNKQEQLSIAWHYPPSATEKFTGTLKPVQGYLELTGKIGDDVLEVKLLKQRE